MNTAEKITLTKKMFPFFASMGAEIEPKGKGSLNGIPIEIKFNKQIFFLKIINNNLIEEEIRGNEEQALKEIESDYVVKLIDSSTVLFNSVSYTGLLFESIDGVELFEIIKGNQEKKQFFEEEEVRKFLQNTVSGIAEIWSSGYVHQDIKPKNIMFQNGDAKYVILDLGITHYAADFQRSTGKQNRFYMTPELLKAEMAENVRVTYNSDLHQLGQIAYEMLTLKHPFIPNGSRRKANKEQIVTGTYDDILSINPDVSQDLVDIIGRMLNPNAGQRFTSPTELLAVLNGEDYERISNFDGGIYFHICLGPQGYKNVLDMESTGFIDGLVLGASQIPADSFISESKQKGYKIIVDPETYLLEDKIDPSWHTYFHKIPWYSYPLNITHFSKRSDVKKYVEDVVKHQLSLKADFIVPPYFNISNGESKWREINGLFVHETIKLNKLMKTSLPILVPICVSHNVIHVRESRNKLVDYYTQIGDIDGFLLRIDAPEHNDAVSTIQDVKETIELLEVHNPVMLLDSDTVAYGYLSFGLSGCATALAESRRQQNITKKQSKKKGGGSGVKEKVLVSSILEMVKYDGDFETLLSILGDDALCKCSVCNSMGLNEDSALSNWSKDNRNNHFLSYLVDWKKNLDLKSSQEKIHDYEELLKRIDDIYHEHSVNILFSQIIKSSKHITWRESFFPSN